MKITAALLTTGLLTGAAYAQQPLDVFDLPTTRATTTTTTTTTTGTTAYVLPGVTAVKTYLTLSDAQVSAIQTIQTATETSIRPLNQQLFEKQLALRKALSTTPVVTSTVTALQADITALQTKITALIAAGQTQEVNTLTTAQKTLLANLNAAAALQQQIQGAAELGLLNGSTPSVIGFGPAPRR